MTDVPNPQISPTPAPPQPVIGRTPYDALAELFGLLGRALPWITVFALALYTTIEVSKSYQTARVDATNEYAARVAELNKLQQSNFSSLETLRNSQLDGLGNFSKLNASMMEAIAKNQTVLSAAREELVKERQNQENAAVQLRQAKRELEEARQQGRDLDKQRLELERKVWAAESIIDAADRLAAFVADRQTGPVSLDRRALSLRFENSSPDAISRDTEGELYYGRYRFPGSLMSEFLKFLPRLFPAMASRLEVAGGAAGAAKGVATFRDEWASLSRNRAFIAAQDQFVEETKFDPLVAKIKEQLAEAGVVFDPTKRSAALRAVLWSVALQHGPNTPLVVRTFDSLNDPAANDEKLIRAIYAERRLVQRYFPGLNTTYKTLLAARYVFEEDLALKMLMQAQESVK